MIDAVKLSLTIKWAHTNLDRLKNVIHPSHSIPLSTLHILILLQNNMPLHNLSPKAHRNIATFARAKARHTRAAPSHTSYSSHLPCFLRPSPPTQASIIHNAKSKLRGNLVTLRLIWVITFFWPANRSVTRLPYNPSTQCQPYDQTRRKFQEKWLEPLSSRGLSNP